MPHQIVLFVCKVLPGQEQDPNYPFTHHDELEWDYTDAVMHCQRMEMEVTDSAADQGAAPQPFNIERCQRSAMLLGPLWDTQHQSSKYRFWKVACPVRIVNRQPDGSETVIGWKLPDCPRGVECEVDTSI